MDSAERNNGITLFGLLWRGGQFAYYWNGYTKESCWFPIDSIESVPHSWSDNNVYFSVHPTNEIPTTNSQGATVPQERARSRSETVAVVNCLFADFDAHDEITANDLQNSTNGQSVTTYESIKNPSATDRESEYLRAPDVYKQRVLERISQIDPPPTCIVDSGGGFHCYWIFEDPVTLDEVNRIHQVVEQPGGEVNSER